MTNKLTTTLLTISILANIIMGIFWFYNSSRNRYINSITETKNLQSQVDTLTSQLQISWGEQKYFLETMMNSRVNIQKFMPEYSDISNDKFIEALRQKVVLLKIKLGEK